MCEQLTADTGAMQETGNRLVSHGYAMSTTLSDDVSGLLDNLGHMLDRGADPLRGPFGLRSWILGAGHRRRLPFLSQATLRLGASCCKHSACAGGVACATDHHA